MLTNIRLSGQIADIAISKRKAMELSEKQARGTLGFVGFLVEGMILTVLVRTAIASGSRAIVTNPSPAHNEKRPETYRFV